jgi:hypothetical protein
LQFLGKAFGQPVFGYADGLVDVPKRVFRDEPLLGLAENNANAGLIISTSQQIVNGGEIEVHLACEFGFESFHFQIATTYARSFR